MLKTVTEMFILVGQKDDSVLPLLYMYFKLWKCNASVNNFSYYETEKSSLNLHMHN